jgi:hypothetical protein
MSILLPETPQAINKGTDPLFTTEIDTESCTLALDPSCDDIYIQLTYHPRRHKPTSILRLDQVLESSVLGDKDNLPSKISSWHWPWQPFPTRGDFELASQFTMLHMDDNHINAFLRVVDRGLMN